jgi:hypothetical protein
MRGFLAVPVDQMLGNSLVVPNMPNDTWPIVICAIGALHPKDE